MDTEISQIRTHITRSAVVTVNDTSAAQLNGSKPIGFWYSVNGDWEEWCRAEMPEWIKGKKYEVTLGDENILKITNVLELVAFHIEYRDRDLDKLPDDFNTFHINWPRIASGYDGIEIAPYQYAKRHAYLWYYTWDCASGCIWRPKGVTLKEVENVSKTKDDL